MEEEIIITNETAMLPVGTVLHGTYRIERYLSSGGFGNTYIATHIDFNETRAIKEFFMKGISKRNEDSQTVSVSISENRKNFCSQLEKFKTEAKRLRKMNNEHIVRVHDLFEENGTAYYVMDFVNGENLNERLKRTKKPLNENEVTHILHQILDALEVVHANNIWHLDLKPANIMVDVNGKVKIIDFGASKQLNAKKGGATSHSAVSYTNGYAPREQMEQSYEKFGPWTDFYALGGTLYCLLTNQKPPMPTDIDDDDTVDKHIALPLPETISTRMKRLVTWLMNTNRLKRPGSVKEIRDFFCDDTVLSADNDENSDENNDDETVVITHDDGDTKVQRTHREKETNDEFEGKTNEELEEEPDEDTIKTNLTKRIIAVVCAIVFVAIIGILWNNGTEGGSQPEPTDSLVVGNGVINQDVETGLGECKYTGIVNDKGMPNGKGIAVFDDGRYYSGGFVNGVAHGDSVYFKYNNGDEFNGSFRNNAFSNGTYTIKQTGEKFVGTFKNGNPHKGKWYDSRGNLLEEI